MGNTRGYGLKGKLEESPVTTPKPTKSSRQKKLLTTVFIYPLCSEAPGVLNPRWGRKDANLKPYHIPSATWNVPAMSLAHSDLTRENLSRATNLVNKVAQES